MHAGHGKVRPHLGPLICHKSEARGLATLCASGLNLLLIASRLGGYWKLPKDDMESPDLRRRIVSAARTSGTAKVSVILLSE